MVIDGITVKQPSLEGVHLSDEPIWSSNTGRDIDGMMSGDVVGVKTTIEVNWDLLTYDEYQTIKNACTRKLRQKKGFFQITYPETNSNGTMGTATKTVYLSPFQRSLYSLNTKAPFYKDVTVTFIEQ